MENEVLMHHQIEYLYGATAKQLFNLALYAVGDRCLAKETAASAFSGAFKRVQNKSDISLFQTHCFRLLYLHGKKVRQPAYTISIHDVFSEGLSTGYISDHKHLSEMLIRLDFEERYIILLFCLQKYSVHQIAKITRRPCFIIEKRLKAAVSKALR